jgi:hypothetical protein
MSKIIVLDAGHLGQITNPKKSSENRECYEWMVSMIKLGHQVVVPEIANYEIRRELLRAKTLPGLNRLDSLKNSSFIHYAPLTTEVMLKTAELWALARQQGTPTTDPKELDGDAILAAQRSYLVSPILWWSSPPLMWDIYPCLRMLNIGVVSVNSCLPEKALTANRPRL